MRADLGWVAVRILTLRRPDVCCECDAALVAGSRSGWDAEARTVTCMACLEQAAAPVTVKATSPALDRGQPGGSLAREYERRKGNREARVRKAHPRVGGLLLALREPPQHEVAFRRGDLGEKAVAEMLERRTCRCGDVLLHIAACRNGAATSSHVQVAPTGVYVIDAKDVKGKVRVASPRSKAGKLIIAERNRTKLIDGLDRQVAAVRAALDDNCHPGVAVQGVRCFTKADLPLFGTLKMRGHLLLYRKALAPRLNADGPLEPAAIEGLAHTIAEAFPSSATSRGQQFGSGTYERLEAGAGHRRAPRQCDDCGAGSNVVLSGGPDPAAASTARPRRWSWPLESG